MANNDNYILNEVFQSFQDGHESGFTALFNEWHIPVCYFAASILNDMQEAEDVTGDCFIKLWEKRKEFTSLLNCKSFLYTSVRNASINILHHRRVIVASEKELAHIHNNNLTLLDQIISSEMAGQINDAMESLPPECRKIFNLIFREGKKNKEVAKILKLSINTVKAQKQRGISLLRKKILPFIFLLTPYFI